MTKHNIYFGDEYIEKDTIADKKHVSFLLGAGFSAPMGYPIGNQLNEKLKKFDQYNIGISQEGKIYKKETNIDQGTTENIYNTCLKCCICLIKQYSLSCEFDYELFFEFLKTRNEFFPKKYLETCKRFVHPNIPLDIILSNLELVYKKMVAFLLKDKNSRSWYDNIPYNIGSYKEYDGFLNILSKWKRERIIHVHTLNHDMLFESFNKTDYISDDICDGFEELGSNFYGELHTKDDRTYRVRLERFTAHYEKNIRLYKLHGSLDYVLFYKKITNGNVLLPVQNIKTRFGVGYDIFLQDTGSKYERYEFAHYANFLTGTTSKIKKYDDTFLFKHLFMLFKNNLKKSEILIIIGYGCKDRGINDVITKLFKSKKIFIVDPYYDNNKIVQNFAKQVGAKILKTEIKDLRIDQFS